MADNISTLIGVIVDVSYSMKACVDDKAEEKPDKWIYSIFKVINDLIKHDVSNSNHMFAIGVGASCREDIFDIISTLKPFQNTSYSYEDTIDRILQILQSGGAKYVRNWTDKNVIRQVASKNVTNLIMHHLESNKDFVEKFVNDFLPEVCTEGIEIKNTAYALHKAFKALDSIGAVFLKIRSLFAVQKVESVVSMMRPSTKYEIEEVVKKAKGYLITNDKIVKKVSDKSSFFTAEEAHRIVHGCVDDSELTNRRIKELLDAVEPFIYGVTPFYKGLQVSTGLFSYDKYDNHKKLLFILSDGKPTDSGDRDKLFSMLQALDVWVICCFISASANVEPKRLYSEMNENWDKGAKFLFDLSSKIPTQLLPRTIFIKRGWQIDIENNETRLFLQVNHPDHIRDACDLARNVVCCQDALADQLSSVSLDCYINQYTGDFPAHLQVGGTCYANATATVIHLSLKRILGRQNGYPDFNTLRQDIITCYGEDGANTSRVLQNVCPQYRLHCQEVDSKGALRAVTAKRPVVATFRLTDREWGVFSAFYENNKTGILSNKEIDISERSESEEVFGHAVVLTSFNSECLRFMNSWGTNWGDVGFFRVEKADVLTFKFFDVFWTLNDLYQEEKDYYAKHGSEVASKLINNLKGLQAATYQCPLCGVTSLVTAFSGNLLRAKCPRCLGEFRSNDAGNILALNMYLTSLSQ